MGINIITRAMVTFFLIGVIYLMFMPVIYMVSQPGFIDPNMVIDSRGQMIIDNAYLIYQASGVIFIVGCIKWI